LLEENALVHQHYTIDIPLAQISDTTKTRLDSQTIPRYRANTLRATLERDTRNDRINPTRGSYQTFVPALAGGWLQGTTRYRKAVLSSTWYTPRTNGWLMAARVMAGVMAPFGAIPESFTPDIGLDAQVARVPRESRFFIGGVNSLRGYGENAVTLNGGFAMALANLELRIPLAGPFGVEVFLDAGNVWDRPEYITAHDLVLPWQATSDRPGDIRYAYGLGGRLVLPFGPLRVDLARADRPDFPFTKGRHGRNLPFAYQFAIGPSF
jgi:outer membrane protein assembly factor BamA